MVFQLLETGKPNLSCTNEGNAYSTTNLLSFGVSYQINLADFDWGSPVNLVVVAVGVVDLVSRNENELLLAIDDVEDVFVVVHVKDRACSAAAEPHVDFAEVGK